VYAHLDLSSTSLDPDQITERLGLRPTETWRIGDKAPNTGRLRKDHRWELQTRDYGSSDLNEPLDDLLGVLTPVAESLRGVADQCDAAMICIVGSFGETNPGLFVDKAMMETIRGLGLDLQLDLYFLELDA
jgi:hypothetical protein